MGNLQILPDHCVRFTAMQVQRGSNTKDLSPLRAPLPARIVDLGFAHIPRTSHHTPREEDNEELPGRAARPVQIGRAHV